MAEHIKGQGRYEVVILPEALDDFFCEDNPVRVIDVFVNSWSSKHSALKVSMLKTRRIIRNLFPKIRPAYVI